MIERVMDGLFLIHKEDLLKLICDFLRCEYDSVHAKEVKDYIDKELK